MSRKSEFAPEDELVVRDFLDICRDRDIAVPPEFVFWAFEKMGYRLLEKRPGDVIAIPANTEVKRIYGDPDPYKDYEDHYVNDGEALRDSLSVSTDTDEAGPSESPEGDAVGDVLQQDV